MVLTRRLSIELIVSVVTASMSVISPTELALDGDDAISSFKSKSNWVTSVVIVDGILGLGKLSSSARSSSCNILFPSIPSLAR